MTTHPFTPPPMGMEYAKILAHGLARVTTAPAHIVDDDGHLILATEEQIADGWWPREQVVYTADAAHVPTL